LLANTSRVLDAEARWRLKSSAVFLASHGAGANFSGAFNLIKSDVRAIEGHFFGKIGLLIHSLPYAMGPLNLCLFGIRGRERHAHLSQPVVLSCPLWSSVVLCAVLWCSVVLSGLRLLTGFLVAS
jgi:hypothetical protein